MNKKLKHLSLALFTMIILSFAFTSLPSLAVSDNIYVAKLSSSNEVFPVDTLAHGQATFKLSKDGQTLYYKLIAANIEDILMAHIHLAPEGTNGPIVAWLYPSSPPPMLISGSFSGVLAEGMITAANLTGPLAGAALNDLIDSIIAGNTYVNVHTLRFLTGEIRGQIF